MITRTGRREHITPVLRELHWLPVRQRIDFKLVVFVHKALHGQLPQYLVEDCQLLTDIGRRSLRSADVLTCATVRTRTRLGDRSFSVAGPCLWNSLPVAYVTETSHLYSLRDFWRHFGLCRAAAHSDCCFFSLCTNILTYLLTYLHVLLTYILIHLSTVCNHRRGLSSTFDLFSPSISTVNFHRPRISCRWYMAFLMFQYCSAFMCREMVKAEQTKNTITRLFQICCSWASIWSSPGSDSAARRWSGSGWPCARSSSRNRSKTFDSGAKFSAPNVTTSLPRSSGAKEKETMTKWRWVKRKLVEKQWRREDVCRPGPTVAAPPPQSDLQLLFLWLQRWH